MNPVKRYAWLKLVPWGSSEFHFLQLRVGSVLVGGLVFGDVRDSTQASLVRSFLTWARSRYDVVSSRYTQQALERLREMGYVDG